ncbi:MAG: hypothetical protein JSR83_17580 [Proteobacteria bacterium]|nr:hypothetical protein [Pseudomonadota bacterium]
MRTELQQGLIPMSVPRHHDGAFDIEHAVNPFVYYGFLFGMLLAIPKVVYPLHNTTGER